MTEQWSHKFLQRLQKALELDVQYSSRFQIQKATPSAVLMLLATENLQIDDAHVLITRRTDTVETHKGQMAFPGGVCDPEDYQKQQELTTALRETHEEVGVTPDQVQVLGRLPKLWTPSGFEITPVVGWLKDSFKDAQLNVNPHEIAETLWVPIRVLQSPGIHRIEKHQVGAYSYPVHVYQVEQHRIWGATAAILWNMLERLKLTV